MFVFMGVLLLVTCVSLALTFLLLRSNSIRNKQLDNIEKNILRLEPNLRSEIAQNREEGSNNARHLREEVANSLKILGDSISQHITEIAGLQKNQLDIFSNQLSKLTELNEQKLEQIREAIVNNLNASNDSIVSKIVEIVNLQKNQFDTFSKQLISLTQMNEQKLESMRSTVEQRLKSMQDDNALKLEQMRVTVDEKLHTTLEKRLGDSFKLVSDRLELVRQGLGEMQVLANGVGDLKKVLTNIKTRGTWGEIQLGNLLEQILSPEQYSTNVVTKIGSRENVEFALRLPGKDDKVVWLPIDAKFPKENYERLLEAQEQANSIMVEKFGKDLEDTVKLMAKNVRDKYVDPPNTTDFGILFLATEGLYAEIIRRPGLCDIIQREYRIVVAGPTTIAALLNSLQMGFRSLAIEKRASEVWSLLGIVKNEFGKFGDLLDKTHKQLQTVSTTIEGAAKKSRTIEKKLKDVQVLPAAESSDFLTQLADAEDDITDNQEWLEEK